jgi:hypothetical protein
VEWNDHCSQFVWKGGVSLKVAFAGQNAKRKISGATCRVGIEFN